MHSLDQPVINVTVVDSNSRPIGNALVELIGSDGLVSAEGTTSANVGAPVSFSLESTYTVVTLRVSVKGVTRVLTVPVSQRNIAVSFKNITLPGAPMKTETKLAFAFGAVIAVSMLVIAMFFPNPTAFQYTVFRIELAVACAGVAAVIPGMLDVKIGTFATAAGALAVFAVVYFYSPAQLAVQSVQ